MTIRNWLEAGAIVTALIAIFGHDFDWRLWLVGAIPFFGAIAAVHVIYPNGGAK